MTAGRRGPSCACLRRGASSALKQPAATHRQNSNEQRNMQHISWALCLRHAGRRALMPALSAAGSQLPPPARWPAHPSASQPQCRLLHSPGALHSCVPVHCRFHRGPKGGGCTPCRWGTGLESNGPRRERGRGGCWGHPDAVRGLIARRLLLYICLVIIYVRLLSLRPGAPAGSRTAGPPHPADWPPARSRRGACGCSANMDANEAQCAMSWGRSSWAGKPTTFLVGATAGSLLLRSLHRPLHSAQPPPDHCFLI